jgi:hypothetical protein
MEYINTHEWWFLELLVLTYFPRIAVIFVTFLPIGFWMFVLTMIIPRTIIAFFAIEFYLHSAPFFVFFAVLFAIPEILKILIQLEIIANVPKWVYTFDKAINIPGFTVKDTKYTEEDAYHDLSLKNNTPFNEVKKRYRELVKKYHPDMCGDGEEDAKIFKKIQKAYEFLKKIEKNK